MSSRRHHRVKPRTPDSYRDALDDIFHAAPNVPDYGGGKWAVYSVGCCWWTSNIPEDVGQKPPMMSDGRFGPPRMLPGLPSCPYCGSVLMQAPLKDFIASARRNREHYGQDGIAAFAAAHSAPCHRSWDEYEVPA